VLEGHASLVTTVSVSPDGKQVVSGSDDYTLRVWDMSTGQYTRVLGGHASLVTTVSVSPDGKQVVSGSYDKTLRMWDIST
jgi:WD40 repeat protein